MFVHVGVCPCICREDLAKTLIPFKITTQIDGQKKYFQWFLMTFNCEELKVFKRFQTLYACVC